VWAILSELTVELFDSIAKPASIGIEVPNNFFEKDTALTDY